MDKTKIEWVKNPDGTQGYTWNPITGCLNHVNGMCKGGNFPCYAYRLAHGRLKERYLSNLKVATMTSILSEYEKALADSFYPRFWPERLFEPLKGNYYSEQKDMVYGKPKGIFACDMADLFGIGIPEEWTKKVLDAIRKCPHHRFYLLTKQPQNLIKFSPFPDNCWVGVTATNPQMFHETEVHLGQITATRKYISVEPMLEQMWIAEPLGIDWLIIGAQTKPYKPPKIEWVQEIVEATDKAGIPVFLKDNLKSILPPFGNELFPPAIRVRQETPYEV